MVVSREDAGKGVGVSMDIYLDGNMHWELVLVGSLAILVAKQTL